jgi:hypothetical protein
MIIYIKPQIILMKKMNKQAAARANPAAARANPAELTADDVDNLSNDYIRQLLKSFINRDIIRKKKNYEAVLKCNRKRYANNNEVQAAKKEVEKYKNILSQEEARAEAERMAEEEGGGFEILIEDRDLKPLNDILQYITQSNNLKVNSRYLEKFIKKNNLKNIDYYEDVEDQRHQIDKIINKLKLLL